MGLKNDKLRFDINKMLETFEWYFIPEESQRCIITEGIHFDFVYGVDKTDINIQFDCFKFAEFLNFCKDMEINLDANELISNTCNPIYKDLIFSFDKIDKMKIKNRKKYN